MATAAEVHASADPVINAIKKALVDAEGGFFSFRDEADERVAGQLRDQLSKAQAALERGLAAVPTGKAPGGGGWSGWREALQILADGAAEQTEQRKWVVSAVSETIKEIPKNIKKDVAAGAAVVGDIAAGAASGFLSKAWWVIGIALVGAGAYLYFQSRLLRGK